MENLAPRRPRWTFLTEQAITAYEPNDRIIASVHAGRAALISRTPVKNGANLESRIPWSGRRRLRQQGFRQGVLRPLDAADYSR